VQAGRSKCQQKFLTNAGTGMPNRTQTLMILSQRLISLRLKKFYLAEHFEQVSRNGTTNIKIIKLPNAKRLSP
jgi:hypothetical protein